VVEFAPGSPIRLWHGPMFRRLLLILVIQSGLAVSALAEPSKLTGEPLRQAVSGMTVLIATPIGSFPIHYRSNGTMTGQAPAFVAGLGTDRGPGPTTAARGPRSRGIAGWGRVICEKGFDHTAFMLGGQPLQLRANPSSLALRRNPTRRWLSTD
jgi:hypothetical protein